MEALSHSKLVIPPTLAMIGSPEIVCDRDIEAVAEFMDDAEAFAILKMLCCIITENVELGQPCKCSGLAKFVQSMIKPRGPWGAKRQARHERFSYASRRLDTAIHQLPVSCTVSRLPWSSYIHWSAR